MNKTIARFDGYELRSVSFDRDAQQLGNWLARDPLHQHLRPAFFLGLLENDSGSMRVDPRPTCYAMEDEFGAIFYIRLERAARVNIQFDPIRQSVVDRARVARALMKGMAILEVGLARARASEWIFDTRSSRLAALAKARLGFRTSSYELVRPIPVFEPPEAQDGPSEARQEAGKEVM